MTNNRLRTEIKTISEKSFISNIPYTIDNVQHNSSKIHHVAICFVIIPNGFRHHSMVLDSFVHGTRGM
jgi:hypothetical protein